MRLVWSEHAKNALKETADYILREYGHSVKNQFLHDVYHTTLLIGRNPKMGKIEKFKVDGKVQYRSIVVNKLNKIVYVIGAGSIEIIAFWDTRREPQME